MEKSLKRKLYILITLSALMVVSLFYLIISGGTKKLQEYVDQKNQPTSSPVVSAAPVPSATPAPTITPTPTPEVVIDTTSDDSLQRIVNDDHPIDASYVPSDLVTPAVPMNGQQQLRSEAASALEEMFSAAGNDGISLYLISGYRSYSQQLSLWYTYEERYGVEETNLIDSHPGACEHQIGLAVDLGTTDGTCELNACFADTEASIWLSEHAYEYGFILRYPAGKEEVTGLKYHPWNYRYIGKEEAKKVQESGLTLEEFYNVNEQE